MSSIYVACGGSYSVNGIYDEVIGGWEKRGDPTHLIELRGSDWVIIETSSGAPTIYKLSNVYPLSPLSTNGWALVNAMSPAPKTYNYSWGTQDNGSYVFNKIILSGGVGGVVADINGTYTYTADGILGHTYVNANNQFRIVQYYSQWQIWPVISNDIYYTFNGIASEPPISAGGLYTWSEDYYGNSSTIISLLDMSDACSGGGGTTGGTTGGVTETTPFLTGKYVYTKDNAQYIRYNNQPYIR